MAEQGTVGHGVTDKSKCCTCTAKWASWHDDESHNMWGAVMPLVIINVLTFIIGVCFLGVSAYMAATFDAWQQYISWTGLIGCAIASLFVCALAILGCCGAIHRNTKILTLYLFFMFIITFITVALALVTLMYGTSICGGKPTEDVTCNANLESREVSNALIKIQTECCQAGSAMKGKGKGANETTHFADTVPMCGTKKNSNGTAVANALYTCMYPECDGSNEGDCVKYFTPCVLGIQKQYPGTKCDRKFPAPLGLTPDAMCIGIKTLIFKEKPAPDGGWHGHSEAICKADFTMAEDLMNNKKSAGIDKKCTNAKGKEKETCMTSARTTWIKVVAMYFSANMTNLGTGLVVLAIVLLIIMFLACCSCCQHKHILEGKDNENSRL